MDSSAMPKVYSNNHAWYSATLTSTLSENAHITSSSKLIYSYTHVIKGFSASLSMEELKALEGAPGYISSIKDLPVKPDTTHTSQFLGLNPDTGAWPESHYGKDVIIGLVDTGVWPESKSFGDEGMSDIPTRLKGEWNYVSGASYFGYAEGTARGVAPLARVAMYKALWDEGAYTTDIIAAIDQAIMDGVDVLSLSFGLDSVPLYQDPVAIATFAARDNGVFVSTSAGNEGPDFSTLHNGIPWVLTVAAGTIDRQFTGTLNLGNGVSIPGSSVFPGNSSKSLISIIYMDKCDNPNKLKKVGHKYVVCEDRNDSLSDQFSNVENANVAGAVFITNNTDLELFIQTSFPAIFFNLKDGEIIKDYVNTNSEPKATMGFHLTHLGIKPAPSATSYTSRGPSPSCPKILKPDIMAPGSLILAAWPSNNSVATINNHSLFSNFNLLSGTSMSCPHAAGVAALIKDIGLGNEPATPLAMGAGHINPNKALDPGLIYEVGSQDYVNLLCALNYTEKQIKIITMSTSLNCSTPSIDLNYPSFIAFFNPNDSESTMKKVREFRRTVTNVGEGKSTYVASVTPMKGLNVCVNPDKLVFQEKNEKQSFKLIIEGPIILKETVVFGYLSWKDSDNKHVVRSSIVATSLSSTALS
uniref:Uncharacterized protein n=1 Tax=Cannabis sativa TaxID=3483 RepID=A0A803NIL9_CANSA